MSCSAKIPAAWKDSYKVNILGIDNDHRALLDLVAQLQESVTQGCGREVISRALSNLVAYVKIHFGREERLMRHHQYPDYAEHKTEHDAFARTILEFEVDYQQGLSEPSQELLQYLKEWIVTHILGTDKKYESFFREKGVS